MEWKRVLCNRKSIGLLICLIVLNATVYWLYLKNNQEDFVMDNEEYEEYIQNYPRRVKGIVDNGERLSTFSVFARKGSFAQLNVEKTGKDYARVKDVKPSMLDNQQIGSLFSFQLVHACVFVFGVWLVLLFAAEKKRSMEILLHTCKNGRQRLFLNRFFILNIGIIMISFLLYLSMVLILALKFGLPSFTAPIQSIPLMGEFTYSCSILEFMVIAFGIQAAGSILALLILWVIINWARNIGVGICIYLLIMGVEYLLNTTVGIQSNICLLRYTNFFFSLDVSELWSCYYNVPLGNIPVSIVQIYLFFLVVCMIGLFLVLFFSAQRRYPVRTKSVITKFIDRLLAIFRKKLARLPVFFWELYKLLWCQKGAIIFVLFVLGMWGSVDNSQMLFSAEQEHLNEFYEVYSGPVTKSKIKIMEKDNMLQKTLEFVEKNRERNVWLVNNRGYEVLLGEEGGVWRNLDSIIAALCILLLVHGNLIYERKRGMLPMLRCGKRGQRWLFRQKQIASDIILLGIWVVKVWFEWQRVSVHYDLDCFRAPVQSLSFLSDITLPFSIGGYLCFIALAEWMVFYTYKNIVMYLSAVCLKSYVILLIGILLLVPNILLSSFFVRDVYTNKMLYFRCSEIVILIIVNIVLYMISVSKWSLAERGGYYVGNKKFE